MHSSDSLDIQPVGNRPGSREVQGQFLVYISALGDNCLFWQC
jgi:hypothetical protein